MPNSRAHSPPGGAEPPVAPACDQCRTRKIRCNRRQPKCQNCIKAELDCDFSNRPKRINHARKLVDDFSTLEARLDSIDRSVAKISQRVSSPLLSPNGSQSAQQCLDLDHFFAKGKTDGPDQNEGSAQPQPNGYSIHHRADENGSEHYYGSTSALSLLGSSRRLLGDILNETDRKDGSAFSSLFLRDPSLRSALASLFKSYPFLDSCREPDFDADGKPVCRPPRSFLNSTIGLYLEVIHRARPIFLEPRLHSALNEYNSDPGVETVDATALSFNNIIVLTLGLQSRQAGRSSTNSNGMDNDLFLSFLKNSRRALEHLKLYVQPRLCNVQALVTLAMVAREYWENQIFERLCHMACQMAKSMGLQRQPALNEMNDASKEEEALRARLFWTLYVLDKERTFMTGVPCDLYFFDSEMQLTNDDPGSTIQHCMTAHCHMVLLWEEVYVALYSSAALRNSLAQRQQQISRLTNLFRGWGLKHRTLLNASFDFDDTRQAMQYELKYCFYIGQVLILQTSCGDDGKGPREDCTYSALEIISEVHGKCANIAHTALLGRLFRCYPPIAFIDLYAKIMKEPNNKSKSDLDLLIRIAAALDVLIDPNLPNSYYAKLHLGLKWCIKVIQAILDAFSYDMIGEKQPASWPFPRRPSNAKRSLTTVSSLLHHPTPSLSTDSSSPPSSSSPSKMARTPPPEDPRPRKRSSRQKPTLSPSNSSNDTNKPVSNNNMLHMQPWNSSHDGRTTHPSTVSPYEIGAPIQNLKNSKVAFGNVSDMGPSFSMEINEVGDRAIIARDFEDHDIFGSTGFYDWRSNEDVMSMFTNTGMPAAGPETDTIYSGQGFALPGVNERIGGEVEGGRDDNGRGVQPRTRTMDFGSDGAHGHQMLVEPWRLDFGMQP